MALILAIDTTAELGGIALYDGSRDELQEAALHGPDGFGHILFDRLRSLLKREGLDISDVECFGAASGPGSFTGVRIGLTAAKGLAEATAKPMVAVSNLRALASFGSGRLRATVLDARRGEVYGALFDSNLEEVQPERVMKFPEWIDALPEAAVEFIGTNLAPFSGAIEMSRFQGSKLIAVSGTVAGAVARIAYREWVQGRAVDPAAVDANYVRRSDAELMWKEA